MENKRPEESVDNRDGQNQSGGPQGGTEERDVPAANQAAGADADQSKTFAIIGYIIPILFFLPLVTDSKDDPFAKYHANQQLVFLLYWVIGYFISSVLMIVLIGILLMPIVTIFGVVLMIMGIINAVNDKMKPLPLIGGITLIK